MLKQRRYGADIKRIQKKYPEQFNYWAAGTGNMNVTEMLQKNRVDFTLELPSVGYFTSITHPSKKLVKRVALSENQPSLRTYIGCTKSPLGISAINQINTVLDELQANQAFHQASEKWLPAIK